VLVSARLSVGKLQPELLQIGLQGAICSCSMVICRSWKARYAWIAGSADARTSAGKRGCSSMRRFYHSITKCPPWLNDYDHPLIYQEDVSRKLTDGLPKANNTIVPGLARGNGLGPDARRGTTHLSYSFVQCPYVRGTGRPSLAPSRRQDVYRRTRFQAVAHPELVRSLAGWDWINEALEPTTFDYAAQPQRFGISSVMHSADTSHGVAGVRPTRSALTCQSLAVTVPKEAPTATLRRLQYPSQN
jgi:hypothetical protein